MKIGILTQPLHDNYGGLLQAYALKETLQSMGHEIEIINRRRAKVSWFRKKASMIKSVLLHRKIHPSLYLTKKHELKISNETKSFQKKYIPELSSLITNDKEMKNLENLGFDAYIVGSDQCWRPRYSPNIRNFFLDFVDTDRKVIKLSYAASFGLSEWEFNNDDTLACKSLIQKFDAVSVRESSGIKLVEKYLGRNDAVHLVDPTMLLSVKNYLDIIQQEKIPEINGDLHIYILDKNEEKNKIVNHIVERYGYKPFETLPTKRLGSEKVTNYNVDNFIYPNPAKWLRGFYDAKFVVTDSFHGTVFSILFNIPFVVIGNKNRGIARFESLLKQFHLEDRFISNYSKDVISEILTSKIEWKDVNNVINEEKTKGLQFLNKYL